MSNESNNNNIDNNTHNYKYSVNNSNSNSNNNTSLININNNSVNYNNINNNNNINNVDGETDVNAIDVISDGDSYDGCCEVMTDNHISSIISNTNETSIKDIKMKVDKAVCTTDALEDLSRAIKFEAVFSSLVENKILAIKRECEEQKRNKRARSLGRILFGKKIFGSSEKEHQINGVDIEQGDNSKIDLIATYNTAEIDIINLPKTEEKASSIILTSTETAPVTTNVFSHNSIVLDTTNNGLEPLRTTATIVKATDNDCSDLSRVKSSEKNNLYSTASKLSSRTKDVKYHYEKEKRTDIDTIVKSGNNNNKNNLKTDCDVDAILPALQNEVKSDRLISSLKTTVKDTSSHPRTHRKKCTEIEVEINPKYAIDAESDKSSTKSGKSLSLRSLSSRKSTLDVQHRRHGSDTSATSFITSAVVELHIPPQINEPEEGILKKPTASCNESITKRTCRIVTTTPSTDILPSDSEISNISVDSSSILKPTSGNRRHYQKSKDVERHAKLCLIDRKSMSAQSSPILSSRHVDLPKTDEIVDAGNDHIKHQNKTALRNASHADISGVTLTTNKGAFGNLFSSKNKQSTALLVTTTSDKNRNSNKITKSKRYFNSNKANFEQNLPSNIDYDDIINSQGFISSFNQLTSNQLPPVITSINNSSNKGKINSNSNKNSTVHQQCDTIKLHKITTASAGGTGDIVNSGNVGAQQITTTFSTIRDDVKTKIAPTQFLTKRGSATSGASDPIHSSDSNKVLQSNCDVNLNNSGSDDDFKKRKRKFRRGHRYSDPILVYPSSSGLQHCILSRPPNQPIQFQYDDDFVYDVSMQLDPEQNAEMDEILPNHRRHKHRHHHHHGKRKRHKTHKILVHDLDDQSVKVIDPDDLPQRARWTIIATAFLLLLMCLLLVGVTLRMAPIIDDMVRQENERLMQESLNRAKFAKNFTEATPLAVGEEIP